MATYEVLPGKKVRCESRRRYIVVGFSREGEPFVIKRTDSLPTATLEHRRRSATTVVYDTVQKERLR